jgi:hypothetical protein
MLTNEKTKELFLSSLNPEQLQLKNLSNTIGDAYIQGIEDADQKWRKAVSEFLTQEGMPQSKMCSIFKKLTLIDPNLNKKQ